jgi:ubiquinol-cytochrome c reductase cytochrome b subunit
MLVLIFAASFIVLGVLGVKAPTPERTFLAQICTILYFAFFLLMPVYTAIEKTKPEPTRVTMDGGIGPWKFLVALALVALMSIIPLKAVGAESAFKCGTIACDDFTPDLHDKESMQRGAKYYMNYCMACHSLQYARYERTATDLGIPLELAEQNLIFDDAKIGDLMENSMPTPLAKKWFGAAPPDLSLISRARSPEWIYTYLRNFYRDDSPSRPYGVNNRVFPDVAMPHVLMELQGLPECAPGPVRAANGGIKRDPLTGEDMLEDPCGRFNIVQAGSMSVEEFDVAARDMANFLAYVAEPMALERQRLGVYVLLFLAFFGVFGYLLNREYWKDVH